MTIIGPQGPQQGDGFSREDFAAIWRFFTRTTVGLAITLAIAAYLLFNLALFAVPRFTLYMAQVKEPGEEENDKIKREDESCLALVVDAKEDCLGDPELPKAGGDLAGASFAGATARAIFFVNDRIDGYFENYYGLTVKAWESATNDSALAERARRRCITQIITDRYGTKNTFAAFTGDASTRNEIKSQIGWFITPIVHLKDPDYTPAIGAHKFDPLRPEAVKETCGD